MSLTELFHRQTLCVALAPDQLTSLIRHGKRVLPGSATRIALEAADGHWQGALAALRSHLGAAPVAMPVSVGLAARWCQFAVLPWSDALLDADSAERFLAAQFGAIFGEAARGWTITCDDAPYGQPRLACAIERELLDTLDSIISERGAHCVSVEPMLSIAWRAIAASKPQAFALVEPGRLVLAAVERGRIVALQAQPLRGAWQAELAQAWQRWILRAPELADITQVALVSIDAQVQAAQAPAGFHAASLAPAPGPAFAAAAMVGG
ncbi:MAG: hypothetical protein V4508_17685 [Pseudomonadota bacterium]